MRLVDLDPRWIAVAGDDRVGITFRCPHCPSGERGETTFLGIFFVEPIDPNQHVDIDWPNYMLQHPASRFWHRIGETFEQLTVTPSVDASQHGHWHGFITNGEVS